MKNRANLGLEKRIVLSCMNLRPPGETMEILATNIYKEYTGYKII